ncbi:MAG TPA: hypothetical protein VM869_08950, partial [Enhygromyxa sp.]|nr:hypothetical protein [Enhygromyxa sp.]
MIEHRVFALSCTACLFTVGCGRLADVEDREGFSTYADDDGDGDDNDDLGEEPGSGGSISESCFDGEVQPGELCQVQAPEPIDAGIDPCSLSVADFDADGRPDLAVPNSDPWITAGGRIHGGALGLGEGHA